MWTTGHPPFITGRDDIDRQKVDKGGEQSSSLDWSDKTENRWERYRDAGWT